MIKFLKIYYKSYIKNLKFYIKKLIYCSFIGTVMGLIPILIFAFDDNKALRSKYSEFSNIIPIALFLFIFLTFTYIPLIKIDKLISKRYKNKKLILILTSIFTTLNIIIIIIIMFTTIFLLRTTIFKNF